VRLKIIRSRTGQYIHGGHIMSNNQQSEQKNKELNQQAIAEGTTPERILARCTGEQSSTVVPGKVNPERLQDGYRVSEGADYEQEDPSQQPSEGYDPTHSGVRQAHNKPGMAANTPGREGQTGWAEQLQNGKTTDTPNRKNPAD
jgi:hypothetical protein